MSNSISSEQLSIRQVQALFDRLSANEPPPVLFRDWARRWLTIYQQGRIKDNTYQGSYWEPVELHLIPYFGDMFLVDIKPVDVAAFFREKAKVSALESIKKMKVCLKGKGIFDTAVENDLCLKNPVTATLKLSSKIAPKEKNTWNREQYEIASDFVKQHGYKSLGNEVLNTIKEYRKELAMEAPADRGEL